MKVTHDELQALIHMCICATRQELPSNQTVTDCSLALERMIKVADIPNDEKESLMEEWERF